MADSSKTVWLGVGWSSLVAGVLMLVFPSARSLPVSLAFLAIIFGWLVFCRLASGAANSSAVASEVAGVRREIVERSGQAIVHVSTEASRQVEEMRNEIRRAQNIFDEAIDKLVSSFHGMHTQIERQQQLGLQVVSGGAEGARSVNFSALPARPRTPCGNLLTVLWKTPGWPCPWWK